MPASTSVRVQDAFMQTKAKNRSIDITDAGYKALAWVLAGWLDVEDGGNVSYLMDGIDFIVVRRAHDGRLYRCGDPDFVATDICDTFAGMETDEFYHMAGRHTLDLKNGRKPNGWRALSITHDDYPTDVSVLFIMPAWV